MRFFIIYILFFSLFLFGDDCVTNIYSNDFVKRNPVCRLVLTNGKSLLFSRVRYANIRHPLDGVDEISNSSFVIFVLTNGLESAYPVQSISYMEMISPAVFGWTIFTNIDTNE
jgi:hypothetical protein